MMRFAVLWFALIAGGVPAANPQNAPVPAKAPAADTAETVSVEFANNIPAEDRQNLRGYRSVLEKKTGQRWLGVFPALTKAPASTAGPVSITCWVHTDGSVTGMAIERSSGKPALDRAALGAISGSVPYEAFPYGIAVDEVKMRFTFSYNGAPPAVSKGNPTTTSTPAKPGATNPNPPSGGQAPVVSRHPQ